MIFKTWLESKRGLGAELAAYLKVYPSFVSKMASGEKLIPVAHMAAIEAFSKGEVTRQEMCPDRWQEIWPELVTQAAHKNTQNIPAAHAEHAAAAIDAVETTDAGYTGPERHHHHTDQNPDLERRAPLAEVLAGGGV